MNWKKLNCKECGKKGAPISTGMFDFCSVECMQTWDRKLSEWDRKHNQRAEVGSKQGRVT